VGVLDSWERISLSEPTPAFGHPSSEGNEKCSMNDPLLGGCRNGGVGSPASPISQPGEKRLLMRHRKLWFVDSHIVSIKNRPVF